MGFYSFYPPSGGGSSNASVATNGGPIPGSSTLVAGENPSGDQQPLQTDATGALITTPASGSVQDVNVVSSVLPTGASTSALQTAGNASLTSIDSKLTAPLSVTGPLTDTQLRASPVPVSAASLPLPTGAATAANQATEIASLASIDTKLTSPLTVSVNNFPGTQPVSGTVTVTQATGTNLHAVIDSGTVAATQSGTWNITNITGTVSLPTGAATETTLSAINTKTPALGQATMANSVPVAIASNQSTLPVAVNTPTATTVKQAAISVGTTAVRATTDGSAPSATRRVLVIQPDPTSTATFYVGSSSVTNSGGTRGVTLTGGATASFSDDAGDYYVIASVAAQTVFIVEQE